MDSLHQLCEEGLKKKKIGGLYKNVEQNILCKHNHGKLDVSITILEKANSRTKRDIL